MTLNMGSPSSKQTLRVLEFYSGTGGMHFALQASGVPETVLDAFDINEVANDVYEHNFGKRPSQGNLQRLTPPQLDSYSADMWLMSPPCQPFTRQGLKKDCDDGRSSSFLSLLSKLRAMAAPPRLLLLENVIGFETSQAHSLLLSTLSSLHFHIQEVALSPLDIGLPYSRPRFYLLARKMLPFPASLQPQGLSFPPLPAAPPQGLPALPSAHHVPSKLPLAAFLDGGSPDSAGQFEAQTQTVGSATPGDSCGIGNASISTPVAGSKGRASGEHHDAVVVVDDDVDDEDVDYGAVEEADEADKQEGGNSEQRGGVVEKEDDRDAWEQYRVPHAWLQRWGLAMDIVTPSSSRCGCITKSYFKFAKGTGSVLVTKRVDEVEERMMESRRKEAGREAAGGGGRGERAAASRESAPVADVSAARRIGGDGGGSVGGAESAAHSAAADGTEKGKGGGDVLEGNAQGKLSPDVIPAASPAATIPPSDSPPSSSDCVSFYGVPLDQLGLRFLTPKEVSRLHGYPPTFSFPPHVTMKQRYALLGNGISIDVVALLIRHLVDS